MAKKTSPKASKTTAKKATSKAAPKTKVTKIKAATADTKKSMPRGKSAATALKKMPAAAEMKKLKEADTDFQLATTNAVNFLESRRQAVFNIARPFHLEPDELFQEGYEVLLTCLRDYNPVFERADGTLVKVKFTTFFGTRMEGRAMEMRNKNPEYQARAAHLSDMSDEEKASFRQNPPLLVQHLDLETPMQEHLKGEASEAQEENAGNVLLKVVRDSFFDKKLSELVAKERDDKKRAILMHVKVGGVYNFQDIAYQFGVTDSRASQILNELMDAFYVQRLLDGNLNSVKYDFQKLKFNDKRIERLLNEAAGHADADRQKAIGTVFGGAFALPEPEAETDSNTQPSQKSGTASKAQSADAEDSFVTEAFPFRDVFTDEENEQFPLESIELREINSLTLQEFKFREAETGKELAHITALLEDDANAHPIIVNDEGVVIDGNRRLAGLQARGETQAMCMTRQIDNEKDLQRMRIAINLRTQTPVGESIDKTSLYYAIQALLDMGISQQKISKLLGISRTNVIVYSKVIAKAHQSIRDLFSEGYIQITNASSCTDLTEDAQAQIVHFIRNYGTTWAKGSQFNTLYSAALNGDIEKLKSQQSPLAVALGSAESDADTHLALVDPAEGAPSQPNVLTKQVSKRLETYEQALKDAEIWTAQREGVITRQTKELVDAQSEIDRLKRELEAAELMQYGDKSALESAFKQLRSFYALSERLAAAKHGITIANKDIRGIELQGKQLIEINQLLDDLDKQLNTLRVEMLSKSRKKST